MKYRYLEYCEKIMSGQIVSGHYLRKAVERMYSDFERQESDSFPFIFLPEQAEKVIAFVRFTGAIDPLPFQEWLISQIYGWRYKDDPDRRRFEEVFISMAKKNGKTLLMSPLLIYDTLFTKKPETYVISTNLEISARSYDNVAEVIEETPELEEALDLKGSRKEVFNYAARGKMKFFSSDKKKNGLGASMLVMDEAAFYDDYVLAERLRSGMRARWNSLAITITTNGENKNLPYYEEYEKNKKILDGIYQDETCFIALYELDEEDIENDRFIDNPDCWIKANPALDNAELKVKDKLTVEKIQKDLERAAMTPSKKQRIYLYNFNLWSDHAKTWIPSETWEKNRGELPREELKGRRCCGGLDIATVGDLTMFTLYFEPIDGKFPVLHRAYIAEAKLREKELHEAAQYTDWIEKGYVTVCPGNTVQPNMVCDDIIQDAQEFNLLEIGIDPNYHAGEYSEKLEDEAGLNLVEIRQGIAHFSPFTKAWERDVLDGNVIDPNPIMAYCLGNAEIRPDANNNYKPLKLEGKYKNKIDAVITSIQAHARMKANLNKKEEAFHSVWDLE